MVDRKSEEDVPPRMLDLLRMFLAASSRGEHTVLVLESRRSTITTKYRCVENVAGVPVSSNTSTNCPRKKVNPARARRSKLRLEEFIKKKTAGTNLESVIEPVEVSKDEEAVGVTSQLVTILPCGENEPGLNLPIPQLDGMMEPKKKVMFTFKSEYGVEDIDNSLSKILPEKAVPDLVSRI